MRVFITGASGLLGITLADTLASRGEMVYGIYNKNCVQIEGASFTNLDLVNYDSLRDAMTLAEPDVVFHTAALTNLTECESNPTLARKVNLEATRVISAISEEIGSRLIFFSTDSVFDGGRGNYREDDEPHPLNTYARMKAMAEREVARIAPKSLIIRSNFYGWGSGGKANFGEWTIDSLRQRKSITCFKDARNTSILVNYLADITIDLVKASVEGIYHIGSRDPASRCDLAFGIAKAFGLDETKIALGRMEDHHFPERRPLDITLDTSKASEELGISMPSTQDCIATFKKLEDDGFRVHVARLRQPK